VSEITFGRVAREPEGVLVDEEEGVRTVEGLFVGFGSQRNGVLIQSAVAGRCSRACMTTRGSRDGALERRFAVMQFEVDGLS
jgi:hypothetical protein